MRPDPSRAVAAAARRAARVTDAPLLLAVSGGLDSMALLCAMTSVAHARIAAVATFDHGTGPAAADAARHVRDVASAAGLPVLEGHMRGPDSTGDGREAAWRVARHGFLAAMAAERGARLVTAHTEDDQLETVLMRVMRGSGARGLAGLTTDVIVRPFVALRRSVLAEYLRAVPMPWVEDPSNASREFLRNRVRHDLLPALRRVRPGIDGELLATARRAALLRSEIEAFVDARLRPVCSGPGRVCVAARELSGYDRGSLAVLWAALAGRAGLALDRRGTERLAEFTSSEPRRGTVPLAGGWRLEATRDAYILAKPALTPPLRAVRLPVAGSMEWGRFRFHVSTRASSSPWAASIAASDGAVVRPWTAGDRLEPAGNQPRRRVTRYLSDVGVSGTDRDGWPVVVDGTDVLWIPGVRRSDAATDRSGGPVRHYVCERIDR